MDVSSASLGVVNVWLTVWLEGVRYCGLGAKFEEVIVQGDPSSKVSTVQSQQFCKLGMLS